MRKEKQSTAIRVPTGDRVFYFTINAVIALLTLLVLVPLLYIVSASFSSPMAVSMGRVTLWPVDFSLEGYRAVFKTRMLGTAYLNTLYYTVAGTAINIVLTLMAAYPLARRGLPHKGIFMFLFTFTMLFSGGMIPSYILMIRLGLLDTRWAMLLPGAISVYNMIIARTFIQNIPEEMYEAASIDGCSDTRYFIKIVLPLSTALISVLTLYYAVSHWNAYFDAFLYLTNRKLMPLQIILREILIASQINAEDILDDETLTAMQGLADLLKYSLIIVSSLPVLVLYPFIKKYFLKGVMLGALKG